MENNLSPETLIEQVLSKTAGAPCLTCSFQAEDMVVLHLLLRRVPEIPVLFLETGYHFAETYSYRDQMTAEWRLNLINVSPQQTVAQQEGDFGLLYLADPTECCRRRKVEPLMAALEDFDIWFTGLRREQSPTRRNLQQLEESRLPSGKALIKVNPLAAWTWSEVQAYLQAHQIETLPLYEQGYLSIGCEPCTSLPSDQENPRSGRWAGKKLECGIHAFGHEEQRDGSA
jgi:phosphoadenosine phosphosulfate reductase